MRKISNCKLSFVKHLFFARHSPKKKMICSAALYSRPGVARRERTQGDEQIGVMFFDNGFFWCWAEDGARLCPQVVV